MAQGGAGLAIAGKVYRVKSGEGEQLLLEGTKEEDDDEEGSGGGEDGRGVWGEEGMGGVGGKVGVRRASVSDALCEDRV